ncbi:MAG: class I SAM-dependent methyltransferase, partial [Desulfobacterota bacterium]|nr:class I SAM-dependent methyltransferase [Thermodesulfobacteriota bacterium]
MNRPIASSTKWPYGMVSLSRTEIHEKVMAIAQKEPRGRALDVPTGTGILAARLKKLGFEVQCCDIDPTYFSAPDLTLDIGDLNRSLPYPADLFDLITCVEGIEHLENPFNAIREFSRVLKPGGKLILTLPNYLNIERRLRFLITGLFSKIPSPKKLGRDRFEHLYMLHLSPLTFPILRLMMEHCGFKILFLDRDKEKRRMRWLLPLVWAIRCYCSFWTEEKKEDYHLKETLSDPLIMGGNTLIVV